MSAWRSSLVLVLAAAAALSGCRDEQPERAAQAASLPPAAPAGQARRIAITVDNKGYHPPMAPARSGESLVLAFTRTEDSTCVAKVIVENKPIELPLNKQVDVPIVMPEGGNLVFTCGMKMFEGRVSVVTE